MTRPILADLHGAALDDAMGRCFSLAKETVDASGRAVDVQVTRLRSSPTSCDSYTIEVTNGVW